jgi:cytochrome P450
MTPIMATHFYCGPDLFSAEALEDPYPLYRELREIGPAAYLVRHDVWFIGRYKPVRDALFDWRTFSSARGIGLNAVINEAWANALICVDPPHHTPMRKLITERLEPRALKGVEDTIDQRAQELVSRLVEAGSFDAVTDLAHDLPVNIVMDLIGWPNEVRPHLLDLAEGSFDVCGPMGPRMEASLPKLAAMMQLITEVYDAGTLAPGGFGSTIADAAKTGAISRETAVGMLAGYVVAAFDTTINAIASGVALFAAHPHEWELLCEDPQLVSRAANEIIRMESPIQLFSRVTTREVDLGEEVIIPADTRVIIGYGCANRDERRFVAPDRFDLRRAELDHVGFGHGAHGCAGQGLARLEIHAIFRALAQRVRRFEISGAAERAVNNVTRGFRRLPVSVERRLTTAPFSIST